MPAIHPAVQLLSILYIVLHLGVPLSSWLMLRVQADKHTHLFFAGLGIYCLSIFLTIYRAALPSELGYVGSSVLVCLSLLMVNDVLLRESTHHKIPLSIYFSFLSAWGFLQSYCLYSGTILTQGVFVSSSTYLFFDLLLAFFSWKIYKKFQSKNILLIVLAGAISAIGQISKLQWLLTHDGSFEVMSFNLQSDIVLVGSYLSLLFVNFGYFGYALEKTQRQKNEALAREQYASMYSSQLSELNAQLKQTIDEKQELLRNLTLSSKAIGMGALAGALAHELNQPLTAIGLEAQGQLMKIERQQSTDQIQIALQRINADASRAADIIRKLRNLFSKEAGSFQTTALRQMVDDVCLLALPQIRTHGIELHVDCEPTLLIHADPTQVHQVLLNLLTNAIHSIEEEKKNNNSIHGKITIEGSANEHRIVIEFKDNGTGFPPDWGDMSERLFDTSRPKGMGIGLWLSHKIVNLHGGHIRFANLPNGGAKVSADFANANRPHIG
jgi:signal transduction histidine kinase